MKLIKRTGVKGAGSVWTTPPAAGPLKNWPGGPRFVRIPFGLAASYRVRSRGNPDYQVVIRCPMPEDDAHEPVGVGFRSYGLLQHRDVI